MLADRAWVKRNLGFDPIAKPAPQESFQFSAAAKPRSTPEDFQREIIDFDSEAPAGREFLAFTTATGLSRFEEIPWPSGLAPKTDAHPAGTGRGPLPKTDVLVVTWTVDEGHALSRVLTPGKDSRNDYRSYTHNFKKISAKMRVGSPARNAKRLGAYWTSKIGGKKVLIFKSDSHLSQDTKTLPTGNGTLPNFDVWKQIIDETRPKLVITTGTAGGIGKQFEVGDVVVSPIVRFDGIKWLKTAPFHDAVYKNGKPNTKFFAQAKKLFKPNADQLPPDNKRPPKIVVSKSAPTSVVTTDFFGFDTSDDHYKLQGLGDVSEMGDAVLGLVAQQLDSPPRWLAVRNVSDPQIKAEGSLRDQANIAAQIYKGFGRWSTVCSAIVC
jgi:nucleoside phosphorylase